MSNTLVIKTEKYEVKEKHEWRHLLKHPLVSIDIERGDKEVGVGCQFVADDRDVGAPSVLILHDDGSTLSNCTEILRAQLRLQAEPSPCIAA